jgi:hypothetical protein
MQSKSRGGWCCIDGYTARLCTRVCNRVRDTRERKFKRLYNSPSHYPVTRVNPATSSSYSLGTEMYSAWYRTVPWPQAIHGGHMVILQGQGQGMISTTSSMIDRERTSPGSPRSRGGELSCTAPSPKARAFNAGRQSKPGKLPGVSIQ